MPTAVTINRPDVVALAMRRMLQADTRTESLFGRHPNSVRIPKGVALTAPAFEEPTDGETRSKLDH